MLVFTHWNHPQSIFKQKLHSFPSCDQESSQRLSVMSEVRWVATDQGKLWKCPSSRLEDSERKPSNPIIPKLLWQERILNQESPKTTNVSTTVIRCPQAVLSRLPWLHNKKVVLKKCENCVRSSYLQCQRGPASLPIAGLCLWAADYSLLV